MRIVVLIILLFFTNIICAQTGCSLYSKGNLFVNGGLNSVITDINTCDMIFEGYESQRIYDREYILNPVIHTRSYKGVTLPPSVYLKIWETHMDTIANTVTKTGNVQLYWVGPRNVSANNKKIWDKIINLCGVRKLSFITNRDSIISLFAVPADWMCDDTLFAVSCVKKYGGAFVASPRHSCIIVSENGKLKEYSGNAIVKEKSQLSYDLNRIVNLKNGTFMSLPQIHDIPTEEEQELNLFARDINRNMSKDVPLGINRRYEITLFIDSLGRPFLHNYHVMIKDSIDNIVLSNLDSLIRINQYDTFCRLLTISGKIFPWRYISATYSDGMWYLKDNIWSVEEKKKYYLERRRKTINPLLQTAYEINKILSEK